MAGLTVELRGLDLHRANRRVLRGIHWRIAPGERWVLVGGNGAGKTQLLKLLAGTIWPDPVPRGAAAPRRYRWRGTWHTDTVDVQHEIAYVGPERQDRYARYDWNFTLRDLVGTGFDRADLPQRPLSAARARRAEALLAQFGLEGHAGKRILEVSSGERRLALLARALAMRPALLLLDELLTHLDAANRQRLSAWLEQPAGATPPWVLSTHRMDHIPASASHALVLAGGRVVAAGVLRGAALRRALRRVLAHGVPRSRAGPAALRRRRGRVVLAVQRGELWLENQLILDGAAFELRAGECWVLSGANGAGKTTLLRALYGDFPFALGSRVRRLGVKPGEALQCFRERCGFVAPQLQTDFPRGETVLDTVLSGWESSYGLGTPAGAAARRAALSALRFWQVARWAHRPLSELSYGQVRRVLFARAWIRRPRVLLLDEPFAGLDAVQRQRLARRIEAAREDGAAVLVSSHHRDEWPLTVTGCLHIAGGRLEVQPLGAAH